VLLLLAATTLLLLPALACSAGNDASLGNEAVVLSAGFSASVDDSACAAPGCSLDGGNFRVTAIPVRSSIKSHDVNASAARPSGLHPSSTTSINYSVNLHISC